MGVFAYTVAVSLQTTMDNGFSSEYNLKEYDLKINK